MRKCIEIVVFIDQRFFEHIFPGPEKFDHFMLILITEVLWNLSPIFSQPSVPDMKTVVGARKAYGFSVIAGVVSWIVFQPLTE